MKLIYIIAILTVATSCSKSGCTDTNAFNYDAGKNITTDNSLCEYPQGKTKLISGGTINSNVTWPKIEGANIDYKVNGLIFISGQGFLTIEPGVVVVFDGYNAGIEISGGSLIAEGTNADKIKFTRPSENSVWSGIEQNMSLSSELSLSNVEIIGAQTTKYSTAYCVLFDYGTTGTVKLNNLYLDGTGTYVNCGVRFYNSAQFNNADITLSNITTTSIANDICY